MNDGFVMRFDFPKMWFNHGLGKEEKGIVLGIFLPASFDKFNEEVFGFFRLFDFFIKGAIAKSVEVMLWRERVMSK